MSVTREFAAEIVGTEHCFNDADTLAAYADDQSFCEPIPPRLVIKPGSDGEVEEVVDWANRQHEALVPVSSGPPHFYGDTAPGVPGAVIVDLSRMNRVLRVDRRNQIAVIEPGVTYAALQPVLAQQGMRVTPPLAPRANKSVIASLLERQPTLIPRYNFQLPEPLRSCGVVWGDGQSMFTGEAGLGPRSLEDQWRQGLLQANPKGPAQTDFFRLLTGAQGTMGIVTWATVKCELVPSAHTFVFAQSGSLERLVGFVSRLNRVRLGDEVMVLSASRLARLVAASPTAPSEDLAPFTLVLGIGGREHYAEERVRVQEADIRKLAEELDLRIDDALPGVSTSALAEALAPGEVPWQHRQGGTCAEIFFLATFDNTPRFLATMTALAVDHGYPAGEVGVYLQPQHQGVSCHVEFSLPYDAADAAASRRMKTLFDEASARLVDEGGYFSRPYGSWSRLVYARDPGSAAALRKVKAVFDPRNVMNPGKLCFDATGREEAGCDA
jgi:FAD/FMN-containing dehydrogenase